MYKKIKNRLTNIKWVSVISDVLLVLGIILITIGAYKIYIPLGYIILGICFLAFAFFIGVKGVKA